MNNLYGYINTNKVNKMSETIVMSLALRKRKTLKSRISTAIRSGAFIGTVKGDKAVPLLRNHKDKADLEAAIKADYQSVTDMMETYHRLVAAIVVSNATTTVTIAGKDYTVADAIERRNSLRMKKDLLYNLQSQVNRVVSAVSDSEQAISSAVEVFVTNNKTDVMDAAQIDELREQAKARHISSDQVHICDPNNLLTEFDNLNKEYEDFVDELETALNIVNARTEISY